MVKWRNNLHKGSKLLADAQVLESILTQVNQLSPEYRLKLIQRVTASLLPFPPQQSKPLQYGKYKGNRMSTLEDFAIAEWRPTDKENDLPDNHLIISDFIRIVYKLLCDLVIH